MTRRIPRTTARLSFSALALAILAGCGDDLETGDLGVLAERGELRIIVPRRGEADLLPRHGHPFDYELDVAASFAESVGLEPVYVWVDEHDDLIPALIEGRGDLVAANLTVTAERRRHIAFSLPVGHVREQIIVRAEDESIEGPADLEGRQVVVRRSSSFWGTLEALRAQYPEIELLAAPEDMDTEEILYRVAAAEFDVSAADDNLAVEVLAYQPGLRVAFDLGTERETAWGLRLQTPELLDAVNTFIERQHLGARRPTRYRDDLDGIRERKVLRVLTRNSASTYYVWRGKLVGFELDLARRFAERIGARLQIIVAPDRSALLTWLRQGRGDVVAAGLTVTEERSAQDILFSRPYSYAVETVVARAADSTLHEPRDLAGRSVVVRRSSAYWNTLTRLQEQGIELELTPAPEELETEEIIDRVANGEYDLTVADSHILGIELAWRDDIRAAMTLSDSVAHAWAVRAGSEKLAAAIDAFHRSEYRGLFYNVTYNKYFKNPAHIRESAAARPSTSGELSPYDDLIREYAERYGFDWRLIAAQMYQESRFDPKARSFAGALGLLQVMPGTARELGIESLGDPQAGVHAGVKYLSQLYDRLADIESDEERLWFALAAYNAGYGHLQDGRRLARELGREADIWFGGVDGAMPLLARSDYYRHARYGYCRCSEPVRYVRSIRQLYRAYRAELAASAGEAAPDRRSYSIR
ncbi:MAG: transporter substrate-binding domain-containing protein [Gemmatimonadales bacterium]|jgi:membrane-bound lytic murein transglycosylase F